ncbi:MULTISPECIES: hypothetical protein [Nocardiopsidaceae]|uniref:Thioredoxin domain-containing protein n=1 Tax=Streptomonospora nanhaiensis TaxID=1323731 RepID=A0ABY6YRI3_9ACTN|nr:hypothetical protein [Streptomonospora nanhaiensis]WAE74999.1 hypothetical protein OUQ99_07905 [Streptomonospora nanhaiensis]
MVFVVVAVALVGALGILNLLLAIGVVRRLREHTALLEGRPGAADDDLPASAAPVGTRVGAFRARSTLGSELVFEETAVPLLVAVLSPDCSPCRERLPLVLDHAARYPGERVLAVVIEEGGLEAGMVALLEPAVPVVVEPWDGGLPRLLDVRGTPCFVTVVGGVVAATSVFAPRPGGVALGPAAG